VTNPRVPRTDPFATAKSRHGTVTGANLHSRLGEAACDACRAAKHRYDQRYKLAPKKARMARLRAQAQGRAETYLRRKYPAEYKLQYEYELAKILMEQTP
jgi:hypothetical protein